MIEEFAPAKINLALHVTGQRDDGYHLLDTLITFADTGDRLSFSSALQDAFGVSGRFGAGLPLDARQGSGNLALRARDLLRAHAEQAGLSAPPAMIHLEKNLPIASGLGGGSADAAAVLRGLSRLWNLDVPQAELAAMAIKLGADVPMCLASQPLLARGIGEDITLLSPFPSFHLLLVNPLVEVSTPQIFRSLESKTNPPLALPEAGAGEDGWVSALLASRNDLQPPAEALAPAITKTLQLLAATRPMLARMTGSGATCFGLYATAADCAAASAQLEAAEPQWYHQATQTLSARP